MPWHADGIQKFSRWRPLFEAAYLAGHRHTYWQQSPLVRFASPGGRCRPCFFLLWPELTADRIVMTFAHDERQAAHMSELSQAALLVFWAVLQQSIALLALVLASLALL